MQSVSGRNECMCGSSHALSCGHMQRCTIHNYFASCEDVTAGDLMVRMSFVLEALTKLNVSELKH